MANAAVWNYSLQIKGFLVRTGKLTAQEVEYFVGRAQASVDKGTFNFWNQLSKRFHPGRKAGAPATAVGMGQLRIRSRSITTVQPPGAKGQRLAASAQQLLQDQAEHILLLLDGSSKSY